MDGDRPGLREAGEGGHRGGREGRATAGTGTEPAGTGTEGAGAGPDGDAIQAELVAATPGTPGTDESSQTVASQGQPAPNAAGSGSGSGSGSVPAGDGDETDEGLFSLDGDGAEQ